MPSRGTETGKKTSRGMNVESDTLLQVMTDPKIHSVTSNRPFTIDVPD